MITFRLMGCAHLAAGLGLGIVQYLGIDTVSSNIIASQLIGGALVALVGFKFKL